MRGKKENLCGGFTLIELVVVMAILVAVGLVAFPRLENLPETRAQFAAYMLRSDVRFAQILALETQTRTRVVFNTASDSYSVERETSPGTWTAVTHPTTKENYTVTLPSDPDFTGVDITGAVFGAAATLMFDSLGAPFDSGGTALAEPAYVELNAAYQVQVRSETGNLDLVAL